MPRLTLNDYLATRDYLADLWNNQDYKGFSALPSSAQRDIHDFFAPAVPMTPHEARMHRQEMTKAFPSLPQKAGRAAAALRDHLEGRPNKMVERRIKLSTSTFESGGQRYRIRIEGVVREKIDTYRLARALLRLEELDTDGTLLAKLREEAERKDRNA